MSSNTVTFDLNGNTIDDTFVSHSEHNVINNSSSTSSTSTSSTSTYENNLLIQFDDDNLLHDNLLKGISALGWDNPSPIQQRVIPVLLDNFDILAQAQSGTGKTGSFSISAIQKLLTINDKNSKVLILSPTKELAEQTYKIIKDLGHSCPNITCNKFIGGVSKRIDYDNLNTNGTNILSGTPGRILDLLTTSILESKDIVLIIIDEADEMLSKDFEDTLKKIVRSLNHDVQIALVSATVPDRIVNLSELILNKHRKKIIKMNNSDLTLEGIQQFYICMEKDEDKFDALEDLYKSFTFGQVVIFCCTIDRVNFLDNYMKERNHTVDSIHGNMSQEERQTAMKKFRSGTSKVLISTDLIARGIDVQQVSIVFNFDMPLGKENYIHRIGRSGRYGRKGLAISFVMEDELPCINELETLYETEIPPLPTEYNNIFGN